MYHNPPHESELMEGESEQLIFDGDAV